jgi:SNF2 family DNA or RNA helicase
VSLAGIIGIPKNIVQAYTDGTVKKFVLRRTKEDVSQFNQRLALPKCEFENVELEMNPEERVIYKYVYETSKDTVKALLRSNGQGVAMMMLECLLRARQAMIWPQLYFDGMAIKQNKEAEEFEGNCAKHDTLLKLIESHPTEKSLVFCQFVGEMNQIQKRLIDYETFRIDGSVTREQREARVEAFRKSKKPAIFIIQIKAGGVGLNLQEATRVYITSPSWNPATELQAIARAHRTGQVKNVVVKKLIYAGNEELPSIEQSIMQLQNHKAVVCAEVLNDPRLEAQIPKTRSKYSIQELKRLFV